MLSLKKLTSLILFTFIASSLVACSDDKEQSRTHSVSPSKAAQTKEQKKDDAESEQESDDNQLPIAAAGGDTIAKAGKLITLDGYDSRDADGIIHAYQWKQISGIPVKLKKDDEAKAYFSAPKVKKPEEVTFELEVTDDKGGKATDTVTYQIVPVNSTPVADAGDSLVVAAGSEVVLDGSASEDPDGYIKTFKWRQVSGTRVDLSSTDEDILEFIAPPYDSTASELKFELVVYDDDGKKAVDTVKVIVSQDADK
ncbi:PKD domain-containing protein [Algicola sagamiensis]|uniref:PKD domain-containing protein n=1 Tax=Algicola sagamiensis TaxID=163869 RepID=UPI00039C51E6|nr:PKD domain-containing protein [Algicola sagamiensis]